MDFSNRHSLNQCCTVMWAFRKACLALALEAERSPNKIRVYPWLCNFGLGEGDLRYTNNLKESHASHYHTIFEAIPQKRKSSAQEESEAQAAVDSSSAATSHRKYVVKFARRYGIEEHKHLAAQGMAPKIFFFSLDIIRGWAVIVMEHIDGQTLDKWVGNPEMQQQLGANLSAIIAEMHGRGFVFGDLREPNILINGRNRVFLIDFDWAGEEGKAR
ncbi:hypothetical protein M427DRAFT_390338 [Gonapodya prolifera JEL478]|uniref:Protein kinase domain-containing protein n=1 Tax=Gonapodya prolifera (strain JEL478) TaxID=1344416 RepID=A0A139A7Y3_GONPJ|nr:hypothetical protein M427DRAFT_390338 [Gonapodya prolifera JEL478]|eukprot:KXS12890.1 hypothetical protein M427DRAFT_390338 [Gonapodya prolifera JEL478]